MTMTFKRIAHLALVNLRYYFCLQAVCCVSILLFTPVVFSLIGLDAAAAAVPLEYMVSLIGIVLMVPVCSVRESSRIQDPQDRIGSQDLSMYLVRLFTALTALFLCIGAFTLYLYANGCQIYLYHFTGAFINAFFLGALGMLGKTLFVQKGWCGYVLPVLYYLANMLCGSAFGRFSLFSMSQGSFLQKGWLLAAAAVTCCICLPLFKRRTYA